jgi:hypothetical protein
MGLHGFGKTPEFRRAKSPGGCGKLPKSSVGLACPFHAMTSELIEIKG